MTSHCHHAHIVGASALLALALLASAPVTAGTVTIDGSSTVFPITEAVAEEFQIATKGQHRVTVGVSGTGGGFKKFCRGEIDVSNASRPISAGEMAECKANGIAFLELPIAFDALAVVVHPKNTWVKTLTVAELKTMWAPEAQGRVKTWNQVNANFPNRPLRLYGPGVDSGTFDYFTEAVVGKAKSSRGDYAASEDDNVLVQGVSGDINALGYFGLAYYEENKMRLRAVPVVNAQGQAVLPEAAHVVDHTYQPLSRPLFIYVSKSAADRKPAVAQFIAFYLNGSQARELVNEVGYVPLPAPAYAQALRLFTSRQTGTAFATGSQVGLTIEDILNAKRSK